MPLRAQAPSTTWTGQSGPPPHAGVRVWSAGLGVALLVGCAAPDRPEPAAWTVTVLAQGGPLHATNGMYFGPDGRLYVVSASSAEVAALDAESGAVLERWGPEEGVQGPDDLIFGPDGSLYWTEFAFGDVARRTPDGTTTVIASPGPGVNPITFSDDGLPETGAATLVADGLTLQSLEQKSIGGATSVGFLSGIAVGDGSLYVSSYAENRVYSIDR